MVFLSCALVATPAVASPEDVLRDYREHNSQITQCHPREDYIAARELPADEEYGDFSGAIDQALGRPALVGTPDRPCPAADQGSGSSSAGTAALVLVPAAALALIGAGLAVRRKRRRGETTE